MTSSLSWSWLPPRCSPNAGPLPASPTWAPKSNREPFGAIKLQLIGEKEARGCLILSSFDSSDCNNLPCWTISTVRQQHWDQSDLTANRTRRRRRSWCCQSRFSCESVLMSLSHLTQSTGRWIAPTDLDFAVRFAPIANSCWGRRENGGAFSLSDLKMERLSHDREVKKRIYHFKVSLQRWRIGCCSLYVFQNSNKKKQTNNIRIPMWQTRGTRSKGKVGIEKDLMKAQINNTISSACHYSPVTLVKRRDRKGEEMMEKNIRRGDKAYPSLAALRGRGPLRSVWAVLSCGSADGCLWPWPVFSVFPTKATEKIRKKTCNHNDLLQRFKKGNIKHTINMLIFLTQTTVEFC